MTDAEDEYTLRILRSVREVPQPAWDALLGADSSPFVEHTWLDMLEETGCVGGETGWVPLHQSLWRGDKLVAVAPTYVKGHSEGEFVFDWGWAELAARVNVPYYPKIVVAVPFTPAAGDRVLVAEGEDRAHVTRLLAGAARELSKAVKASSVHVLFPRAEEGALWEASGYLRRDGFQYHWFREGLTSFDGYLARFTSKQRNQIKRELRTVRERGIVVETLGPEAHTPELARTMHSFYASTIDKHGVWGRMYLNERFFLRAVERFKGRLAWVVAKSESGEVLGGAFNVVGGKRLYGRYWGAATEIPCLHFVVCYYAGIACAIERGLDVFEPGAGGEHKRARGFVPTLTRSAHWLGSARLRTILEPWLARERQRIAQLMQTQDGDDVT
jgi:uncharacterized protein